MFQTFVLQITQYQLALSSVSVAIERMGILSSKAFLAVLYCILCSPRCCSHDLLLLQLCGFHAHKFCCKFEHALHTSGSSLYLTLFVQNIWVTIRVFDSLSKMSYQNTCSLRDFYCVPNYICFRYLYTMPCTTSTCLPLGPGTECFSCG